MARAARALGILGIVAAMSCAAVLGDDFTISNDEDDGSGTDCSEPSCNACGPENCAAELQYCIDVGCLDWYACNNGEISCDFGGCDDCWPEAASATTIAGECVCIHCKAECCAC